MASSKLHQLLLFLSSSLLLSLIPLSSSAIPPPVPHSFGGYEIKSFTQTLDHFNFYQHNAKTFQQRYLINDTYWGGAASAAPIFVYLGGEGNIEDYARGVGFPFDTAPYFHSLIVYIEHRFYGESYPFEDRAVNDPEELGYLSISQALSDFATLIADLKRNLSTEKSPVIVFGGSYSGMLAAWFRLKYPHIAHGALASSAPILLNIDLASPYAFDDVITNAYKSTLAKVMSAEFKHEIMNNIAKSFNLCPDFLEGIEQSLDWEMSKLDLYNWMHDAIYTSAESGYPTWFHGVPPYPNKLMCEAIDNAKTGTDNYSRVAEAMQVFYNASGNITCFEVPAPQANTVPPKGVNGYQLPWQDCAELQMMSMYGGISNESIFLPGPMINFTDYSTVCSKTFNGSHPRQHWLTTEFGGHDIKNVLKRFGSNIIFFNGLIDPWSGGSVKESISESIIAINAPLGAHAVDLKYITKEYPGWFRDIRKKEMKIISKWLKQYYEDHM